MLATKATIRLVEIWRQFVSVSVNRLLHHHSWYWCIIWLIKVWRKYFPVCTSRLLYYYYSWSLCVLVEINRQHISCSILHWRTCTTVRCTIIFWIHTFCVIYRVRTPFSLLIVLI